MRGDSMNQLTEQEKEQLKQLTGIKTYPGVLSLISLTGILLALIGCLCPFFSYNPTVVDDFKRTIGLFDLTSTALIVALIGLLFLFATLFLLFFDTTCLTKYIKEPEGKSYGKRMIVRTVSAVIFALLSLILVQLSALFYEIPESSFEELPLESDAGSILYYIGVCLFCCAALIRAMILKNVMDGKTEPEKLGFGKKQPSPAQQNERSPQQLSEWKKLLDEGAITQEEYDAKKEEFLKQQ